MGFNHYYNEIKPTHCTQEEFDILLSLGWYPLEQRIFTTSHLFTEDGTFPLEVFWLRYPVFLIQNRSSHRRIRSKNRNFALEITDPLDHRSELDDLYEKYLGSIDFEGYSSVEKATFKRGSSNIYHSKALVIREGKRIVSCGIFHEGITSAASILHFYDPEYSRFSPGKYLILKTLDYCKLRGLEWYYPKPSYMSGHWLSYKSDAGKLFCGQISLL